MADTNLAQGETLKSKSVKFDVRYKKMCFSLLRLLRALKQLNYLGLLIRFFKPLNPLNPFRHQLLQIYGRNVFFICC